MRSLAAMVIVVSLGLLYIAQPSAATKGIEDWRSLKG